MPSDELTPCSHDRSSDRVALLVNSALAFSSAEMITAALHEAGHGIAAQWLGFSPHIYAFYDIVAGARYADGRPPVESERGVDAPLRIEPVALALYAALVLCYVFAFSRGVPV